MIFSKEKFSYSDLSDLKEEIEKHLNHSQKEKFEEILDKKILALSAVTFLPEEKSNIYFFLKKLLSKLRYLDTFQLETENEIVKKSYKETLDTLKWKILTEKNILPLNELIDSFIKEIPLEKTKKTVIDINLDKKWSFSDVNIKMINFANYGFKKQVFILDYKGLCFLIEKLPNTTLKYKRILKYKVYFLSDKTIIETFDGKNYNLLFNYKNELYTLTFGKNYFTSYLSFREKIDFFLHGFTNKLLKKLIGICIIKKKISERVRKMANKSVDNKIKKNFRKKSIKNIGAVTNIGLLNENLSKKSVMERKKIIKEFLNSSKMSYYYNILLTKLKNKSVVVGNKKLIFTEKFINQNKQKLISNLKTFLLFIFSVESDFDPLNKSSSSSAQGLAQWLVKDGKIKIDKKGHKYRGTSSWETTLNLIIKNYHKQKEYKDLIQPILPVKHIISNRITPNINEDTDSKLSQNQYPDALSWQDQIKILTLALPLRGYKFLMLALLGNEWGFINYYKYVHHTKPDKATKERIKKRFPIYKRKLFTYLVNKHTWMKYVDYLAKLASK